MIALHESTVKVHGIAWDRERAMFRLQMSNLLAFLKAKIDTKRLVLRVTCRINSTRFYCNAHHVCDAAVPKALVTRNRLG